MNKSELIHLLENSGAILNGHFLLTSGKHSKRYIEKFRVLENPDALDKVCKAMSKPYQDQQIDIVLGAAIGGILIAGGVGRHLGGVKHIFAERIVGNMTLRRGFEIPSGSRVLIVEDVISTGGSVIELIELANEYNAEIVGIVNLVERSLAPIDFGYSSTPLLNLPIDSWDKENCPLCKDAIPITHQGRSGK